MLLQLPAEDFIEHLPSGDVDALRAKLCRQIEHIPCDDVELPGSGFIGLTGGSILIRAMDESCAQSEAAGSIKIANVCCTHHDLFRLEAQQIGSRQVCFAI